MPLALSTEQRSALEAILSRPKVERRVMLRAQAVLLMADAVPTADVAAVLGVDERTVQKWRVRFTVADPLSKLADAPRPGRPPSLSPKRTRLESNRMPASRRAASRCC